MIAAGDVISYHEMCMEEGVTLQRGMNFRLKRGTSIILMSLRRGAPYADEILDEGKTLIYEGHDISKTKEGPDPKSVSQPMKLPSRKPTQNGLFYEAAIRAKQGDSPPEPVRVYEKIRDGVWAFDGIFHLVDAWQQHIEKRTVFKFKLILSESQPLPISNNDPDLPHNRIIPADVKLEVWKRDKGKCIQCGSRDNLHFDHIIPYSQGGSSLIAKNIQLLCARHNLQKRDKIL